MSTQLESGVDFALVREEQHKHFRLLELPPELLSLLTSENPPVLQLKASEGAPGQPLESNTVLCTPNKTYSLRQVSTSNSLFITQTTERPGDSTYSGDSLPRPRVEAIGKAVSTLEVHSVNDASAHSFVKTALPVFTSTGHAGSTKSVSKRELFANIPLSDADCEDAWAELACFELKESSRSCIPSLATRWQVWQTVKTLADAEGLDLTKRLTGADREHLVSEAAEDVPAELVSAVLRSVSREQTGEGLEIDSEKCVRFVGRGLLAERTEDQTAISTTVYLNAWKERLPHQWENRVEVGLLSSHCRLEDGGRSIAHVDAEADAKNASAATETKSTLGAKRKWHEKFRASKKAS